MKNTNSIEEMSAFYKWYYETVKAVHFIDDGTFENINDKLNTQ